MFRIPFTVFILFTKTITLIISKEIPLEAPQQDEFRDSKSSKMEDLGSNHPTDSHDAPPSEDKIAFLEKKLKDLESLLSSMPPVYTEKEIDNDLTRRQKRSTHSGTMLPPQGMESESGNCGSYNPPYYTGYPLLYPCAIGCPQVPPSREQPSPNDQTDRGPKGQGTFGATYVRWGRSDCPETAQKIYDGVVGGSWTLETGNGANYLCLPNNPTSFPFVSGLQSDRSRIRSVELHATSFPIFSHIERDSRHDLACAVCGVTSRSTVLTVPAWNTCPSEAWTFEYTGFIASQKFNHDTRSEYICLDGESHGIPGTSGDSAGGNIYITETVCTTGGLPCGPYVNGYELPCVVCTM